MSPGHGGVSELLKEATLGMSFHRSIQRYVRQSIMQGGSAGLAQDQGSSVRMQVLIHFLALISNRHICFLPLIKELAQFLCSRALGKIVCN